MQQSYRDMKILQKFLFRFFLLLNFILFGDTKKKDAGKGNW